MNQRNEPENEPDLEICSLSECQSGNDLELMKSLSNEIFGLSDGSILRCPEDRVGKLSQHDIMAYDPVTKTSTVVESHKLLLLTPPTPGKKPIFSQDEIKKRRWTKTPKAFTGKIYIRPKPSFLDQELANQRNKENLN